MSPWASAISAITLFVEDLTTAKQFYLDVFGLPVHFEDSDSVVFRIGPTLLNLLSAAEAPELIAPSTPGGPDAQARSVMTINVEDVDAAATAVVAHGALLLNGPMDRSWGVRTASFRDPAGHIWELAT